MSAEQFFSMFNKQKKRVEVMPSNRQPFRVVKEDPDKPQDIPSELQKRARNKKRKRLEIKNDQYEQLMMLSVPVRFPKGMSLYPTQKLMIVRILAALKSSQNVLGESPTGSGKTMALLSSTCAWLNQYIEEKKKSREKCPIHGSMGGVRKEEYGEEEAEENQSEVKVEVKQENIAVKTEKKDLSPKIQDFSVEEQWRDDFIPHGGPGPSLKFEMDSVKKEEKVENAATDCTCMPRVRIYYGTRTHKQIAQVVKEFSRLPYANIIKHTILASRDQSCINPTARKQPDISGYCKEINSAHGIGCQFKNAMRPRFEKASMLRSHLMDQGTMVFDMEEIVETLALAYPQICPYFSTNRILTQDADLIFCPFSYLVDPLIRNSSDVHVKNSVVILDEAHNIEDTCREAASFTFTEKELDDSLLSFRLKRVAIDNITSNKSAEEAFADVPDASIHMKEFKGHLMYLEHLTLEILRWVRHVAEEARTPPKSRQEGLKTCTLSSETLFSSLTNAEIGVDLFAPPNTPKHNAIANYKNSNFQTSFGAITKQNEPEMKEMDQFKPSATAIVVIEKWLYFQSYFGNQQYRPTYSETRSIILASGTLCPMDTLKTELGMEFKQQVEGDQVISPDNIFAAVLPIGPHGNRITCTYRNTSDPESPFYEEVASIVKYVCTNVPAGILCFLPSYRVLEQLKMCMYKNQSMLHIKSKKVILFEPRRSSELSAVMDEFDEAIFNPTRFGATINGALMFAVFRGKVSEGIDFADDRARVVISVGIPYPNAMDDQVNAKKMYNDQNSKEMGILNGDEWYTTQAYRALNQALGRCLRHKNDWGAMLMIDDRLERQTSQLTTGASSARVSKWIRAQLKSYPSFRQFNANFREFIERRLSIVKKEQEDA
ncbi:Protein CBR-DOG-1 [Caenorhabditis briggsae]|uniref:Protein CBR-DOG-1 n=1 Tax=Caenorhabditis briggsae TaxID=6238 RepID=A8XWG9_CAEBR|nr:Protein CBR-DOG-1 [Caenorhabditis briggsae]CAP36988.2 Protein CBR-DOG-1 [Caenorhabditis briggsae]